MKLFEVVVMNQGKIASSTIEFTPIASEAIKAFNKCREYGKTILQINEDGSKHKVSVREVAKFIKRRK